jgi:Flp pilus assembly protein TadG
MRDTGRGLKRTRRAHSAQAIVEFAFVAPIFLLVLFGIIEVGRLMIEYTSIANAAREGARRGAIPSYTVTEIQTYTTNFVISVGTAPVVTVQTVRNGSVVTATRETGDDVQVTVSHTFQPLGYVIPVSIPLSSTARMRVE